jgi:chemotaxis protein methyltransferase CheR
VSGLDTPTFNKFRDLVYEKSGISLGPQKAALVSARIGKRMRTLGMDDYNVYLNFVSGDKTGEELVQLLDAISTNVTSFFRESGHFDFLAEALKKWRAEGQSRYRLWCAAASSGEEPYSLAMTMTEALGSGCDIKILATDISTKVLGLCQKGVYAPDKVKTVPPQWRDRYFEREGARQAPQYVVRPNLRRLLLFKRLNLSKPPFPMKGPLDVVFCRNVMIYFDNEVRSRLLSEIYRLLKPGGYLMVGHAESLTGMVSKFKSVQPSVYVK